MSTISKRGGRRYSGFARSLIRWLRSGGSTGTSVPTVAIATSNIVIFTVPRDPTTFVVQPDVTIFNAPKSFTA